MKLLSAQEYNELVQAPSLYFSDEQIRSRRVATDSLGLPQVFSGNFAYTYRFKGTPDIAVRCFHRAVPKVFERYREITRFLRQVKSEFFLEFDFHEAGLNAPSGPLPVLRMPWVNGPTLLSFMRARPDAVVLNRLRDELFRFSCEQMSRSYAHGDVQPRNILIEGARLKFVDYDGMFVPGIDGLGSADLGHPDYQSPLRGPEHFGPWLDRFSLIALDLSLQALAHEPGLMEEFDQGDNLVLSKRDFVSPATSPALRKMELISDLKSSVTMFRDLCSQPCNHLPTLEQYRANKVWVARTSPTTREEVRQAAYQPTCQVVEGGRFVPDGFAVGARLEIVGSVAQVARAGTEVKLVFDISKKPVVSISERLFRAWSRGTTITAGTPVSVTGAVERRKGRWWQSEAILVARTLAELEVLPAPDWIRYRLGELEMKQAFRSGIAVSSPEFVRKRRTQPFSAADLRAASQTAPGQSPPPEPSARELPTGMWIVLAVAAIFAIILVALSGR